MKDKLRLLLASLCIAIHCAAALPAGTAARIDSLMKTGVAKGYYPGASIAVGCRDGILFDRRYGWQDYTRVQPVDRDDVYDLASCTKIVSTTLAVMRLYDLASLGLDDRVGALLPDYAVSPIASLTVRELLTHTSGLGNISVYKYLFFNPAGLPLISPSRREGYERMVDRSAYICDKACCDTTLVSFCARDGYRRAGEEVYVNPAVDSLLQAGIVNSFKATGRGKRLYSDLNFHLLKLVVEKVSDMPLDRFVAGIYAEMEMAQTGYRPLEWTSPEKIIPTEDDVLMQRGLLRGYTHDEIAAVSDNVGGNAGLFSNAADLSRYCMMLLGDGTLAGRHIISPATVRLFTSGGLGFDRNTPSSPMWGGYGHTGYTGTIIWIDPSRNRFMVFLSNRVNPSRTNQGLISSALRTKLWETVKVGK